MPKRTIVLSRPAFSLLELLIALAIISMLLAFLLPTLICARRRAAAVACASNLRQIHLGICQYAQSNRQRVPRQNFMLEHAARPGWDLGLSSTMRGMPFYYHDNYDQQLIRLAACVPRSFLCPSDGGSCGYALNLNLAGSKITHAASNVILAAEEASPHTLLFLNVHPTPPRTYIALRHGGMANWLYSDGHVELADIAGGCGTTGSNWGADQRQNGPMWEVDP